MHSDHFAFVELFNAVGERYSKEYVDKIGWQYSHQWTTYLRDSFTKWLAETIVARKILPQKEAEIAACFWIHRNGWQVKNKV